MRIRDRSYLVTSAAIAVIMGGLGILVTLLGRSSWLAWLAGPVITAVLLIIAYARRPRAPKNPPRPARPAPRPPRSDVFSRIREYRESVSETDAEEYAERAMDLMHEITRFQLEQGEPDQQVIEFLETHTRHQPVTRVEWNRLVTDLETALNVLKGQREQPTS